MADLIDRQAAIDFIDAGRLCNPNEPRWSDNEIVNFLKSRPSAQPEPRWIPCEERFPENGHYYLWCSDMGSVQSDYYWNGFENGMKYGYNIVAWMPLPEAYKGGTDG